MVVHQDTSKKGHHSTLLKSSESPHWALFDDHKVQWIQEQQVLVQEATILIYTRPTPKTTNETVTVLVDEQGGGGSPQETNQKWNNHPGCVNEQMSTVTSGGSTIDKQDTRVPERMDDDISSEVSVTLEIINDENSPDSGSNSRGNTGEEAGPKVTSPNMDSQEGMDDDVSTAILWNPERDLQIREDAKQA